MPRLAGLAGLAGWAGQAGHSDVRNVRHVGNVWNVWNVRRSVGMRGYGDVRIWESHIRTFVVEGAGMRECAVWKVWKVWKVCAEECADVGMWGCGAEGIWRCGDVG